MDTVCQLLRSLEGRVAGFNSVAGIEHIIGIDLGTTNSVVAIIEDGEARIIPSAEGQPRTPSVVAFQENGDVVIGEIARRQAATQPKRTISSVKRLIGRLKQEIDEGEEAYPFQLGEDERGMIAIIVEGHAYSPEQISALILGKLKQAAEDYIGGPIEKAVVTVPAYFDDIQRQATIKAAELAGLEVVRLINEPTAAAMAYGLNKDTQETVAIYDFGGGTFDFSLLDIDHKAFEVLTSTGNSRLGGDDLDMALVDHLAENFQKANGLDLRSDPVTLRRLKDEAERAKCELSTSFSAVVRLPFIATVDGKPLHMEETIKRETLEDLIESYISESLQWCTQGLKEANLRKSQVTKVILVGGTTRIPLVQDMVEDYFGAAPFRGVNPDEVVAIGAAMQGAVLSGELEEVVLLDVTPHTLGIEVKGNQKSVIIEKNSTIPIKAFKTFTTTEDNQTMVNIHLLQGEEPKASECRSLGKFTLSGIPESRAGQPRIRVEIFVNADGVVEISATEAHSGKEQKLVTSCTYLNADERRAQHTASAGRRKRRRRRGGEVTPGAREKILRPASAKPGETPPARPASVSEEDTGRRVDYASTFAEVDTKGRKKEASSVSSDAVEVPPSSPTSKSAEVASPTAPPRESAPRQISDAAGPPEPLSPPPSGSAWRRKAAVSTGESSSAMSASPPSVKINPPETLKEVFDFVSAGRNDEAACETYTRRRETFLQFCKENESDPGIQAFRVRFLNLNKQPEDALAALSLMREQRPDAGSEHLEMFNLLCSNFPNYVAARRERASLSCSLGDYEFAMADLEFITKREEESVPAVLDQLSMVYERILTDHPDAATQFKLVKLYLRKGELDDAISLLQHLVQVPEHRERATKVLGYCFWQKGLRYLSWQKFKTLPVDEEMKDILYRLSADMEQADELVHAQHVLERLYGADIHYRDCADRLKKITYRVGLLQDERYGAPDSPLEEATPAPKVLVDRFELLEEINRGSMGIVYKARDRILDEVVAIKVLNDFLCADPQSVKRFKSEAKSARRLTHGHIVRIHDFYDLEHKVISMEYIEGEDLRTLLGRHSVMDEEMVREYLKQICEALAYAHKLGIVHRDIKPANIMIEGKNQVKITDFGIAKMLDAAASNTGTMIVGTPLYMSPEQIDGRSVDQRADIYALGIMLYELVTGNPPFHEGNIEYQHLHKPVPPITENISEQLKKIIYKCVEKNPDDRFQSVEELRAALETPVA